MGVSFKIKKKREKRFSLLTVLCEFLSPKKISISFFTYVMMLLVIGIIMMGSASYVWAYSKTGDGLFYIKKQSFFAIIGFFAMFFFMNIDYHNFKKINFPLLQKFNIAPILYFIGAIMLVIVLIFGNTEEGAIGAKRWIDIGGINFQPSEIAKFTLIVFLAYSMENESSKMQTFKIGIIKHTMFLGLYVLLIAIEKHISCIMLILSIAISLIFCGGSNRKHFTVFIVLFISITVGFILWQKNIEGSYVHNRIISWLNPFSDSLNITYQTDNSIIAIGSGGLFGLGFGNSRQKYLYLPESQNDFVFPIVCEELGFIGAVSIIVLFLLLVIEGYAIATRCKDRFGMLLAIGINTQIGIQSILNFAVVSNMIPNTGISLPFFSYGGTALVMQLVEMGIMLNISKQTA